MLKVKPTVFREGLPASWNSGALPQALLRPAPSPSRYSQLNGLFDVCSFQGEVRWLLARPTSAPPSKEHLLPCRLHYFACGCLRLSLLLESLTCGFLLVPAVELE